MSDVILFGNRQGIVNLDPEDTHMLSTFACRCVIGAPTRQAQGEPPAVSSGAR
jgi:hypothetical protein